MLESIMTDILPAIELADNQFLEKLESHFSFSFDIDKLPEPFNGLTLILSGRILVVDIMMLGIY